MLETLATFLIHPFQNLGLLLKSPRLMSIVTGSLVGSFCGIWMTVLIVYLGAAFFLGNLALDIASFVAWGNLLGLAVGAIINNAQPAQEEADFGSANFNALCTSGFVGVVWGASVCILWKNAEFAPLGAVGGGVLGMIFGHMIGSHWASQVYRWVGTTQVLVKNVGYYDRGFQTCYRFSPGRWLVLYLPLLVAAVSLVNIQRELGLAFTALTAAAWAWRSFGGSLRLMVSDKGIALETERGRQCFLAWEAVGFVGLDDTHWHLHIAPSAADLGTASEVEFPWLLLSATDRVSLWQFIATSVTRGVDRLEPQPMPTLDRAFRTYHDGLRALDHSMPETAERHFVRARELLTERNDAMGMIRANLGLADSYMMRGNASRAVDLVEDAERQMTALGSSALRAEVMLTRTRLLHLFFRDETALQLAESARATFVEQGDKGKEAQTLELIGVIQSANHNWIESLKQLTAAQKLFEGLGQEKNAIKQMWQSGEVLCRQGEELLRQGQRVEAGDTFRKAALLWENICRQGGRPTSVTGLSSMGLVYVYAGLRQKGLEALVEAVAKSDEESFLMPESAVAYHRRGLAQRFVDDWAGAYDDLRLSVDRIEAMRRTLASEWQKQRWFSEDRMAAYCDLILLCLSLPERTARQIGIIPYAKAFEYMERSRSRAFLDLLGESWDMPNHRSDHARRYTMSLTLEEVRQQCLTLNW